MKNAVLLTSMPSPYMVELIEAVRSTGRWKITPIFEKYSFKDRKWKIPSLNKDYIFLENGRPYLIEKVIARANIIVIGSLWGNNCKLGLKYKKRFGKILILWGERPGAVWQNAVAQFIRRIAIGYRFGQADAIWGIGSWALEEYKKCLPRINRTGNMPYASNLAPFFNIPLRNKRNHHTEPIKILFSGSLIYRKGVDILIKAFVRILKEGQAAFLTLMGEGDFKNNLTALVPDKYQNKINYLGFIDWNNLAEIYAAHELLVVPSRYDGWGLVVIEGLAAGMPVIATEKMGSARDFITHGMNGWIISENDEKTLYETILKALAAPLDRMGIEARKSVEPWTLDKAASHWCDLADEAAGAIK